MQELETFLLANGRWSWSIILFLGFISTVLLKFILKMISYFFKNEVASGLIRRLKIPFVFASFITLYSKSLDLNPKVDQILHFFFVITFVLQFTLFGLYLLKVWKERYLDTKSIRDPSTAPTLGLIHLSAQVLFLSIVVLIALSNLGVNIGALLAGLGVGGIALALAAQNVLGDLLASLSILLDKPFEVGDTIMIDKLTGTVLKIGIKSTRLKSISGEELILSNKFLLEGRIHNYKRMQERRVVQKINAAHTTQIDLIKKIPIWAKNIVDNTALVRFERCHLMNFGSQSLEFELVFWIIGPSYMDYANAQEKILMQIYEKFQTEKIEFFNSVIPLTSFPRL